MSYKYGINGNDLNWDSVMFLNQFCYDLEKAINEGDIELDEDGSVPDDVWEGYADSNPTIVYYPNDEIDVQEFIASGEHITKYVEWAIVHDTNGNFVELLGDVPDEYLTEEYVKDRIEYEGK